MYGWETLSNQNKIKETLQQAARLGSEGKWNEAEKLFRNVVNEDSASVVGWAQLGLALMMQGNTKKAIDSLKKALEIDASYDPAWVSLGQLYFNDGKINEAEEAYQSAIKYQPNLPLAWIGIGLVRVKKKQEADWAGTL